MATQCAPIQRAQSFPTPPMPPFGPHVVVLVPDGGIADSGDEIADSGDEIDDSGDEIDDSEDELGEEPKLLPRARTRPHPHPL